MTSYSVDMLKRSAFQDELNNVLALEKTRIRVGGMMHSYVVSYLKQRIEEIDRQYKDV
jgi:hypothetical protein